MGDVASHKAVVAAPDTYRAEVDALRSMFGTAHIYSGSDFVRIQVKLSDGYSLEFYDDGISSLARVFNETPTGWRGVLFDREGKFVKQTESFPRLRDAAIATEVQQG